MIDQLENKFREAGLVYRFDQLQLKEVDFLPEPAVLKDGILYKVRGPSSDQILVSACGSIATQVYRNLSEEMEEKWRLALFSPTPTVVATVQRALSDSTSFVDAVNSLGSPITRLVAIHLFNALIKSGVAFEDAKNIDLSQWGCTADLATGRRSCSLLPLLGAYSPSRLYSYFPDAVTSLVINGMSQIAYSDVRGKFSEIVRDVFNG